MCRGDCTNFSAYTEPSPKNDCASLVTRSYAWRRSSSRSTRRIPFPPPPALALIMIGKPVLRAKSAMPSNDFTGSVSPGTTGTPAACIRCRLSVFEPIASIDSGDGPMKISPASRQARAKAAFSARKP